MSAPLQLRVTYALLGDGPTPLVTVAIDRCRADLEVEAIVDLAVKASLGVIARRIRAVRSK